MKLINKVGRWLCAQGWHEWTNYWVEYGLWGTAVRWYGCTRCDAQKKESIDLNHG